MTQPKSNGGYNALSNRQRKLQLEQMRKRDAEVSPPNQSPFRILERQFKRKLLTPDPSTYINCQDMAGAPSLYRDRIRKVKLAHRLSDICSTFDKSSDGCDDFGYTIDGLPGLIIIPNSFSAQAQKRIILETLEQVLRPPYITNLDTHYTVPPCGLYDFYTQHHLSADLIPLKLDLSTPVEQRQPIEVTKATAGYHYDGLNESGQPIKRTNLEPLPITSLLKKLRWVTLGYQYHWPTKQYLMDNQSGVPQLLNELCKGVVHAIDGLCFPDVGGNEEGDIWQHKYPVDNYEAEAGVVNFYQEGDSLMAHVDRSEPNQDAPLISFSFGCSGIFLIGGSTLDVAPVPLLLQSGDLVILSGPARLAYHGVPRVLSHTLSSELTAELQTDNIGRLWLDYLKSTRININLRQVH